MTDLEISKGLALAIGWLPDRVMYNDSTVRVLRDDQEYVRWCDFDYRDWAVIGPIAARYNCFPWRRLDGSWGAIITGKGPVFYADTPQKAIALVIIDLTK